MRRELIVPGAAVVMLLLAGCSRSSPEQAQRLDISRERTASSSSAQPSSPTLTSPAPSQLKQLDCDILDAAVLDQGLNEALAFGKTKRGFELRRKVALTYLDFSESLTSGGTFQSAPDELVKTVVDWAKASNSVARYLVDNKPPPGQVLDFGPAIKRFDAAQKAAEKYCGHSLPKPP